MQFGRSLPATNSAVECGPNSAVESNARLIMLDSLGRLSGFRSAYQRDRCRRFVFFVVIYKPQLWKRGLHPSAEPRKLAAGKIVITKPSQIRLENAGESGARRGRQP